MATMTVFFDDPFWVGVLELPDGDRVRAVRHVFGAEPTDPELYEFLLRHGTALLARADQAAAAPRPVRIAAKKRSKHEPARPSTAAQEAMRLELEARKRAAGERGRERREAEAEHRRAVRRAKAKARHRGH